MTTPVLEVGGSHVTAALVDRDAGGAVRDVVRRPLDAQGAADDILDTLVAAADAVCTTADVTWGAAVPGPFDYETGVARYRDVGKFDALDGVDVGHELSERMAGTPAAVRFVNDANAFGLGEWHTGAADGHARAAAITLGTGIGSAFLADGHVVEEGPTVPPGGRAHLLRIDGRPLEETVSSRAMLRRYAEAGGDRSVGLDVVATRALDGDPVARAAVIEPLTALGAALAPWLMRFEASVLVVGGSISRAWSLVQPALRSGLAVGGWDLEVVRSVDSEASALRGAALWAATSP